MGHNQPALQPGEHGTYGDLVDRALPEGLRPLFMPSLAALLGQAEALKGAPLTEPEVLRIRDGAQAVVTHADVALAVEAERGYAEVDPANAWESWQALRGE
jgi:hypothetical protein